MNKNTEEMLAGIILQLASEIYFTQALVWFVASLIVRDANRTFSWGCIAMAALRVIRSFYAALKANG